MNKLGLLLLVVTPLCLMAATREPLGPCSRKTELVFSEIMYHPKADLAGKKFSFIELYNSSPFDVDISGYQLMISTNLAYLFEKATVISPHGFLVVTDDVDGMRSAYGLPNVAGPMTNSLPNDTGLVRLFNRFGGVLLSIRYTDTAPWPVSADGEGHSLALVRPSLGESNALAWAASTYNGGSPGRAEPEDIDPLKNVVINEFRANSLAGTEDFIELYNHGSEAVSLVDYLISYSSKSASYSYYFPPETSIPAGGVLVFYASELGFTLNETGSRIVLCRADGTRVIDAVHYDLQPLGTSLGRFPDGSASFFNLSSPTPGEHNQRPPQPEIVINEISYMPIGGGREYIELFNRSTNKIDLTGWRISGETDYQFVCCTTLYPGQFRTLYAGEDFPGSLSDYGQKLTLKRPVLIFTTNSVTGAFKTNKIEWVEHEVTYYPGGQWGKWSAGGGGTLELKDTHANATLAPNWSDSLILPSAQWNNLSTTGIIGEGLAPCDTLEIMLRGEGEALLDDVQVTGSDGANRIANSGFDTGTTGWLFQGNHIHSSWNAEPGTESGTGSPNQNSLHIRASGNGDPRANRILAPLNQVFAAGETVKITARARWLVGKPKILIRLKGSDFEISSNLDCSYGGTPNATNSVAVANAGPAIVNVSHFPVVPATKQAVTITARVDDPDGITSVRVLYRLDPVYRWLSAPMNDSGTNGDLVAGDGTYSTAVPGQAQGTLAAFIIEATDSATNAVTSYFPAGAPVKECLVRWGDNSYSNDFGTYRLWMTQATYEQWRTRDKLSNEPLDVTFVYGTSRAIYNAGALYTGSATSSAHYDTPTGALCGYDVILPSDDRLFGETHLILDFPTSDATAQRQQTIYWFMDQLDLPSNHRQYINLFVNGVGQLERSGFGVTGTIYEDTQEPDINTVYQFFPSSKGGHLYKADDWTEYSTSGQLQFSRPPMLSVFKAGTNYNTAAYRWNWREHNVDGAGGAYDSLYRLVASLHSQSSHAEDWQSSTIDIESWMRTFAGNDMAANWDSFGNPGAKNTFLFCPDRGKTKTPDGLPDHGRFQLMSWDFDTGLGMQNSSPTDPLFACTDPALAALFDRPACLRAYWRTVEEACSGFLSPGIVSSRLLGRQALLASTGTESPASIIDFIELRRAFLTNALAPFRAPWAVTSTNVLFNILTLSGTAPLCVLDLRCATNQLNVTWTSVTQWQASILLKPGLNDIVLQAIDRHGVSIPDITATMQIQYDGVAESPTNNIIITEVLNNPAIEDSEYIEILNQAQNTAFDLGQIKIASQILNEDQANRLKAPVFGFRRNCIINPGERVVIPKNIDGFFSAFDASAKVGGEFDGDLFDSQNGRTVYVSLRLKTPFEEFNPLLLLPRFPMPTPQPGQAIQLIDPQQLSWHPGNWAVDDAQPVTPGTTNSVAMTLPPFLPVIITDVIVKNTSLLADSFNEFDPFIGLANGHTSAVDVTGMELTMSSQSQGTTLFKLTKRDFSSQENKPNTQHSPLPDGGLIYTNFIQRVWMDAQPEQTSRYEWHGAFRPLMDDGRLALYRNVNGRSIYLDHLDYSSMNSLVSRPNESPLPDYGFTRKYMSWGFGSIGLFMQYLPGTMGDKPPAFTNIQPSSSSSPIGIINEWMASNTTIEDPADGDTDDWFELFNPLEVSPIHLDGCILSNSSTNTNGFIIPIGTIIPPRGFLMVWADGKPELYAETGELHVPFKLSKGGEEIALFAPNGELIQSVKFGPQTNNISQGLYPNGDTKHPAIFMTNSTPGLPNYPDGWPICDAVPPLRLSIDPNTNTIVYFIHPDCPSRFVGYCADSPADPWWDQMPKGQLVWDVNHKWYWWIFVDPNRKHSQRRFYRVIGYPR